jgi:hypothetical protein
LEELEKLEEVNDKLRDDNNFLNPKYETCITEHAKFKFENKRISL